MGRQQALLAEEVAVLLWGEGVDLAAPECKLAGSDFLIDGEWNVVYHLTELAAYLVTVLYEIFSTESLDCE